MKLHSYTGNISGTAPSVPSGAVDGYATDGDPLIPTAPTTIPARWFYEHDQELYSVINSAGLTPSHTDLTQLSQAIQALAARNVSVSGAARNLKIVADGVSATIAVTADELVLLDASGGAKRVTGVSFSVALTTSGAGGLDTGAVAGSTWYALWATWNGTTVAGLASLSTSAPTLPGGVTHKCRIGRFRTDGTANKYPLKYIQRDKVFMYSPGAGSNLTTIPQISSGTSGTVGTTLTSVSVANYFPDTAIAATVIGYAVNNTAIQISPNAVASIPGCQGGVLSAASSQITSLPVAFDLESSSIYWASNGGSNAILAQGFTDS